MLQSKTRPHGARDSPSDTKGSARGAQTKTDAICFRVQWERVFVGDVDEPPVPYINIVHFAHTIRLKRTNKVEDLALLRLPEVEDSVAALQQSTLRCVWLCLIYPAAHFSAETAGILGLWPGSVACLRVPCAYV